MARTPEERREIAFKVMEILSEGHSMRYASERLDVPFATAHAYCHETKELADQYTRARECGALYTVEGMPEKIEQAREKVAQGMAGADPSTFAKLLALEIDALKWQFSKTARGLFGDKSQVEHSGSVKTEPDIDLSKFSGDDLATMRALLEKGKPVAPSND